jgi:hypothetical protein
MGSLHKAKENKMAVPVGITKKHKDNSKKLYRSRAEWMVAKKLGRPKQKFNERTNEWEKVTL